MFETQMTEGQFKVFRNVIIIVMVLLTGILIGAIVNHNSGYEDGFIDGQVDIQNKFVDGINWQRLKEQEAILSGQIYSTTESLNELMIKKEQVQATIYELNQK